VLKIRRDRGSLDVGCRADVVLLDDDLNVWKTLVGGSVAYTRPV
jgi:N-acetylglucosamine-6-phosphate deacetylase